MDPVRQSGFSGQPQMRGALRTVSGPDFKAAARIFTVQDQLKKFRIHL